jgi:large subunit ribosomal protein L28
MSRTCEICGKGGNNANIIRRRGKAKKKGGVGRNITSVSSRTQRPNLKKVKAIIDGSPKRIKVCTKCIKSNKVKKVVS